MDAFFTPIFIIMMVCLLLECFSLLRQDMNMAIACRLIITMLIYLGYVIKRELILRALRQRRRKLLHLCVYVLFICCTVSGIFHSLLFVYFVSTRLYSLCVVVVLSLPVALDEYCEILWLKERHRFYKLQRKLATPMAQGEETEETMRTSLYYAMFKEAYGMRHYLLDEVGETSSSSIV